jgi:hypothetical protein
VCDIVSRSNIIRNRGLRGYGPFPLASARTDGASRWSGSRTDNFTRSAPGGAGQAPVASPGQHQVERVRHRLLHPVSTRWSGSGPGCFTRSAPGGAGQGPDQRTRLVRALGLPDKPIADQDPTSTPPTRTACTSYLPATARAPPRADASAPRTTRRPARQTPPPGPRTGPRPTLPLDLNAQ